MEEGTRFEFADGLPPLRFSRPSRGNFSRSARRAKRRGNWPRGRGLGLSRGLHPVALGEAGLRASGYSYGYSLGVAAMILRGTPPPKNSTRPTLVWTYTQRRGFGGFLKLCAFVFSAKLQIHSRTLWGESSALAHSTHCRDATT